MKNFITNNETTNLKKRLIELIQKSDELKFLVGFFYFSGIRELYEGLKENPVGTIKILVGLNVDKANFGLCEFADKDMQLSDEERYYKFLQSVKKSLNCEEFDTAEFYEIETSHKYILDRSLLEKIYSKGEEEIEAELDEFAEKLRNNDYPKNNRIYELDKFVRKDEFMVDINSDLALFDSIIKELAEMDLVKDDPKAECLLANIKDVLIQKPQPNEPKRKVIIFSEYKDFRLYSTKRILVRQIPSKPPYCIHACLVEETILNDLNSMNIVNIREKPEYVLGILNSRLISWWFVHKFGKMQRTTFPQFKVNELADFLLPKDGAKYRDEIANLVGQILATKKLNPEADITAMEQEIDRMVYNLYGLTEEEIAIVEGSVK
ncbi:MAG: TaqI-like C-terminal specificity domain-containing protein [Candidatus Desantisbacteria bacterium]